MGIDSNIRLSYRFFRLLLPDLKGLRYIWINLIPWRFSSRYPAGSEEDTENLRKEVLDCCPLLSRAPQIICHTPPEHISHSEPISFHTSPFFFREHALPAIDSDLFNR